MNARVSGFTLLEVLVAIALVGVAGSAMLLAGAQSSHSVEQAQAYERRHRRAERLLAELSVANDSTLASLVGRRELRGHLVMVSRRGDQLYHVEVREVSGGIALETALYRGAGTGDAR
jgi:prepilin-type N-terminal cleavage/methylation domain-containing protein